MIGLKNARTGSTVSLSFKIGKLTIGQGQIIFQSERLSATDSAVNALASPRNNSNFHTAMQVRPNESQLNDY